MHDIALMQSIADAVAEKLKGQKVKEIKLCIAIGALHFVEAEHAKFWLQQLLCKQFGDKLKTKIRVEAIKPEIKCGCGFQGAVKSFETTHEAAHAGIFEIRCPKCGSKEAEIVKGKECVIKEITVRK
jgi:Zn finger protein HypA/HybF involved in hydrogenase expression